MSEYDISFEEAMKTPLARAFALRAIVRVRRGGASGGPDYYERIAVSRAKAQGLI